jgi:hypothetical protein
MGRNRFHNMATIAANNRKRKPVEDGLKKLEKKVVVEGTNAATTLSCRYVINGRRMSFTMHCTGYINPEEETRRLYLKMSRFTLRYVCVPGSNLYFLEENIPETLARLGTSFLNIWTVFRPVGFSSTKIKNTIEIQLVSTANQSDVSMIFAIGAICHDLGFDPKLVFDEIRDSANENYTGIKDAVFSWRLIKDTVKTIIR